MSSGGSGSNVLQVIIFQAGGSFFTGMLRGAGSSYQQSNAVGTWSVSGGTFTFKVYPSGGTSASATPMTASGTLSGSTFTALDGSTFMKQ